MIYWKIESCKIVDDGRCMEVTFKDVHGVSQMTSTMAADKWFKALFNESEIAMMDRRLNKALENMCHYAVQAILQHGSKQGEEG